ncbi:beta-hexosaminidase [Actibacterium mucosum KCTC 23349]|uniref:beta-N-acetylhexosaminidase n=1 Tax=Actibacterium mucosum KCTC 23349 TaxID=1454373 RepID=A0A037ZJL3_9RHOB|nr:beta-N-acetylhexosaminidase [Actibacterium mucosum]KAJ56630.1 beta-hexosaminidase [Actibacterium mucosum KCTC 23349]
MTGQGAFISGCAGPVLGADEAAFFREADPWGFILFARNLETPDQIRKLTADLRDAVGRDAPILIDQEGGRVQRLRGGPWTEWVPPLDQIMAAGPNAAQLMRLRYRVIAAELRALGIDVNCAPCADVARDDTHPILRNRCYGTEAAQVVAMGRAVADGLLDGGVLPVLKHIPGHGAATVDSHLELPVANLDNDTLQAHDFAAFSGLADLPMAMTAHVVFPAIDAGAPATTSRAVIRVIRDQIGFAGLLMSDDISMQALSGPIAERSRAALAAGCDLILHCNGDMAEMQAVASAAGRLSDLAVLRADAALRGRGGAAEDPAALQAEWARLVA